jgi:hypothetical protein
MIGCNFRDSSPVNESNPGTFIKIRFLVIRKVRSIGFYDEFGEGSMDSCVRMSFA